MKDANDTGIVRMSNGHMAGLQSSATFRFTEEKEKTRMKLEMNNNNNSINGSR